jgi:peptidoglycan hydrolase-like protein with peptidoglycan-binding domain
MPSIGPYAQSLVSDAHLSLADVQALRSAVQSGTASVSDVEVIASRYADAMDSGVGSALQQLANDLGSRASVALPIANLANAPGLLNGSVTLSSSNNRDHAYVPIVQRALMALASRNNNTDLMPLKYGADGDFGDETTNAVKAFQQSQSLPVTGSVDMATAQALDAALRKTNVPPIFAGTVTPSTPQLSDVKDAALALIQVRGAAYGQSQPWQNIDPRHAMAYDYHRPLFTDLPQLTGVWKCNLFACATLAAAGFEPPYFGNQGHGEYPVANQLYKWSDTYASQFGNASAVRFNLRAEIDPSQYSDPDALAAATKAVLETAQPGDLIIVRHPGGGNAADGGHCRVCIENDVDTAGTVSCAQGSFDAAVVKDQVVDDFSREDHVWVLRPMVKRPEGKAAIQ